MAVMVQNTWARYGKSNGWEAELRVLLVAEKAQIPVWTSNTPIRARTTFIAERVREIKVRAIGSTPALRNPAQY
jgi:hypothetical protein